MRPKRYGLAPDSFDLLTIKNNYQTKSDAEIALLLDRTKSSVTNIRVAIGLFPQGKGKRFTKYEVDFVKSNYHSMTDEELAIKLNRSTYSIKNFRSHHKINRQRAYVDRYISKKVLKMKNLIYLCEITTSPYVKDKYKEKLRKLSGL